jgi:tRNA dimethylallyltransferase
LNTNKKLIAIVGPTAVGKTAFSIELAMHLRSEIISADARQIYRELVIGTAKPSPEQLAQVKHHFINIKSIHEAYDAGSYGREALLVINDLFKIHDSLILCGGSGLYVKALLEGFDEMPNVPPEVRESINQEYQTKGLIWLQQEVKRIDPNYFEIVDKKNPHRLIRALELNYFTGKQLAAFRQQRKTEHPFEVVKFGLELPREELFSRIDQRMDAMINQGLFEEAERFYDLKGLNALQTVGYQEIIGFMDGLYDKDEAIRLLKRNSRRYAKRQMTWFKKDKEIKWLNPKVTSYNLVKE